MLRFAAGRAVQMLVRLWVALTAIFVAVTQLPGDPVRALFGFEPPPPEIYEQIRERFALDEPLWVQCSTGPTCATPSPATSATPIR